MAIEYTDVRAGGSAHLKKDGLRVTLSDGETTFIVPPNEVLMLREFCNSWMEHHGARDNFGREVIDPASGNL